MAHAIEHREKQTANISDSRHQDNGLVTVAPPYDDAFIAIRRHLAPSAIFTYDRYWIMTERQAAKILAAMKEWIAELTDSIGKAEAVLDENDREARRGVHDMHRRLRSMKHTVPFLERPVPFTAPHDADEGLAGDPNSRRHQE